MKDYFTGTARFGSGFLPVTQIAVASGTVSTTEPIFHNIDEVVLKACELVDWLFTGALILTVIFVLLAAIKYITKGSDPKEVSAAHQMLIWAAIGIAVAIMAAVVPGFVASILGTPLPHDAC